MKQVYLDQNVSVQDVICLDVKQAHHIFDVLRTTSKEKIRIVTKNSGVFFGHVENKPNLVIDSMVDVFEENQSITLCCALIKQDKFEWMLQKACELGVHKIVPFVGNGSLDRTSPSLLRNATSPEGRGFDNPHKVSGFAKGSPFGGAGERQRV